MSYVTILYVTAIVFNIVFSLSSTAAGGPDAQTVNQYHRRNAVVVIDDNTRGITPPGVEEVESDIIDDDEDTGDDVTESIIGNDHLEETTTTDTEGDVIDSFLRIVEKYDRNKDNCTPGTTFNLGDGVVAQYGLRRFRAQAMVAVTRANFLTRVWKGSESVDLMPQLNSEYFFYSAVRSMVEGDDDIFAAGNCYDAREYKTYSLFCPYAYRLPADHGRIMVKDLSVEYKYLGTDSEFFYQARLKAQKKLTSAYNMTIGE